MKGAVFIAFNDMIEGLHGIEKWEAILNKAQPESEGIYASAGSYADEEIVQLVLAAADELDAPASDITRSFGKYLFGELNKKFPIFASLHDDLFSFLNSIESVIHKEVRKLYNDASLPKISCSKINNHHFRMTYESPRKMCALAEGLILGAAEHYQANASLSQPQCMHEGSDQCHIDIVIDE
ncbi:Haem-NO-binding [Alteromonadaceae bacterium Bs31]|nr:Haem-NO-binding [Alteromonadaceae bacterium Bs31]